MILSLQFNYSENLRLSVKTMNNLFTPAKYLIKHKLASKTSEGGNAFALMGAFSGQAKKEGWTKAEIDAVMTAAMSGDYDNLRSTLKAHCKA